MLEISVSEERRQMEYPRLYQMRAKKPFLLTKSGLDNLRERLDTLMRERLEIVKRMQTMDQEDKDPLVLVDEVRRLEAAEVEVANINNILAHAEPVIKPKDSTKVQVGSTVTLQDNARQRVTYTIVCPLEVDLGARKISEESPLGRGLLGKILHDIVSVSTPGGEGLHYKIINIQ
jgi:transcription elongation factor GreA